MKMASTYRAVRVRKGTTAKNLEADWNARTADAWKPHPMFGKMTPKEWGKLLQIHLDYHLRQFAASLGVSYEGPDSRSNGVGGSERIGEGSRTASSHTSHSAEPKAADNAGQAD